MKQLLATYTAWDKLAHFIGGVVIFAVCHLVLPTVVSIGVVVLVAVVKEIYDKFHPLTHTADVHDAIATVMGGLTGMLCTVKI
jgi:VanZ family protein